MQRLKTPRAGRTVLVVSATVAVSAAIGLLGHRRGSDQREDVFAGAVEPGLRRALRRPRTMTTIRAAFALGLLLAVLDLSVLAFPATFGGYSAQKKNLSNGAASGTLKLTTSPGAGSSIFQFSNALPGVPQSANVTVTNSGALPATMSLGIATIVNKTCALNGLSCPTGVGTSTDTAGEVTLTLQEGTSTPIINNVTVDAAHTASPYTLTPTSGTQWAPGEHHTYTLTMTLPNTADDTYQGTSVSLTATFTGAS